MGFCVHNYNYDTAASYFISAAVARNFAAFGAGTAPFVMDNVHCTGNESHLVNCSHLTFHNCVPVEAAGVHCNPPCLYEGELALAGGKTSMEGRVEICNNGLWGTVCDDGFDAIDASVICRQLEFPSQGELVHWCNIVQSK